MTAHTHLWVRLGKVLDLDPSLFAFFRLRLLSVDKEAKLFITPTLARAEGMTLILIRCQPDWEEEAAAYLFFSARNCCVQSSKSF